MHEQALTRKYMGSHTRANGKADVRACMGSHTCVPGKVLTRKFMGSHTRVHEKTHTCVHGLLVHPGSDMQISSGS